VPDRAAQGRRYQAVIVNAQLMTLGSRVLVVLPAPVTVLAGALGCWRFGADPGWTNHFFIASGFLSHWQAWFAVAIGVQASSRGLNRWMAVQNPRPKRFQADI